MVSAILGHVLSLPIVLGTFVGLSVISYLCFPRLKVKQDSLVRIVVSAAKAFLLAGGAVIVFVSLFSLTGMRPTFTMVLIPAIGFGLNAINRLNQEMAGTSNLARWSAQDGIHHDSVSQVRNEWAVFLGEQTAFFGVALIFKLPFI